LAETASYRIDPVPPSAPTIVEHLSIADLFCAAVISMRSFGDDAYWSAVLRCRHQLLRRAFIAVDTFEGLRQAQSLGWPVIAARLAGQRQILGFAFFESPTVAAGQQTPKPNLVERFSLPGVRSRRAAIEASVEAHKPRGELIYLRLIAVDPKHQGAGVGRALIAAVLEAAEAVGVPVALDTSSYNVDLYRRFGFEVESELDWPLDQTAWLLVKQ
jgi:ribosomal protein S18 acetylase RimI-like enzyme